MCSSVGAGRVGSGRDAFAFFLASFDRLHLVVRFYAVPVVFSSCAKTIALSIVEIGEMIHPNDANLEDCAELNRSLGRKLTETQILALLILSLSVVAAFVFLA